MKQKVCPIMLFCSLIVLNGIFGIRLSNVSNHSKTIDGISITSNNTNKSKRIDNLVVNPDLSAAVYSIDSSREIDYIMPLYNLDDSLDFVYVGFKNDGYAIFFNRTLELLEFSSQGKIDYNPDNFNYYFGPTRNYVKSNNHFAAINRQDKPIFYCNTDAIIAASQLRNHFISKAAFYTGSTNHYDNNIISVYSDNCSRNERENTGDRSVPHYDENNQIIIQNGTYIANYQYFVKNPKHGHNSTGTCGAIASQLLLSYHNYYSDRRLIDNRHLNGDSVNAPYSNPNYCSDPMSMASWVLGTRGYYEDGHDDSNSYFAYIVNNIPSNAYDYQVTNGINTIISNRNGELANGSISHSLSYHHGGWFFGVQSVDSSGVLEELNSGRPIILLMQSSLGAYNHYLVGYGHSYYAYPNSNSSYLGYITHLGYDNGPVNLWVNSSWCYGYYEFKINHIHDYQLVGNIGNSTRKEYKCSVCNHRTDAAIKMIANSRYEERLATIPQNDYSYKDFYLTTAVSKNFLIQTFGGRNAYLTLYDDEYNTLCFDDNDGHLYDALFSYTIQTNKAYILRVKFSFSSLTGSIKVGITPSDTEYDTYEEIEDLDVPYFSGFGFNSTLNTTFALCFTSTVSGTYTIRTIGTNGLDTYLYIIDPNSLDDYLYDDDSGGNYGALLTIPVTAGVRMLAIISTWNITTQSGHIDFEIDLVT